VAEYLAVDVVGEGFGGAVRVADALHFAVGLAFQRGGLVQRIGHRDQVLANPFLHAPIFNEKTRKASRIS